MSLSVCERALIQEETSETMPFLALLVPAGNPTRSERWMLDADMPVGESVTSFLTVPAWIVPVLFKYP